MASQITKVPSFQHCAFQKVSWQTPFRTSRSSLPGIEVDCFHHHRFRSMVMAYGMTMLLNIPQILPIRLSDFPAHTD